MMEKTGSSVYTSRLHVHIMFWICNSVVHIIECMITEDCVFRELQGVLLEMWLNTVTMFDSTFSIETEPKEKTEK